MGRGGAKPFCCKITADEAQQIEAATIELTELALQLLEHICCSPDSEFIFEKLKIPAPFHPAIRKSWQRGDRSLYGRFDFAFDGRSLKLLEMNFDTPTSVYEAAVLQWFWLDDCKKAGTIPANAEQANTLHERLVSELKGLFTDNAALHFLCVKGSKEDRDTVAYLQSCALLAGKSTEFLYVHQVGISSHGHLIDLDNKVIRQMFKLYPWECLMDEDLKKSPLVLPDLIESDQLQVAEPLWRVLLSNKGILPLLWQMAPGHSNLLESSFNDSSKEAAQLAAKAHVRKPVYGREGADVTIVNPEAQAVKAADSASHGDRYVLQAYHQLPTYEDWHIVTGSWLVGKQPAGVSFRADNDPITRNTALFVPHYII